LELINSGNDTLADAGKDTRKGMKEAVEDIRPRNRTDRLLNMTYAQAATDRQGSALLVTFVNLFEERICPWAEFYSLCTVQCCFMQRRDSIFCLSNIECF